MESAIRLEGAMKKGNRAWKIKLIEVINLELWDLYKDLLRKSWIPAFAGMTVR
jgi:predicted GIY-YIG superfamily endonuclease